MSQSITKSLDSFFSGEDQVIVIKGAWGVGKTFLWDAYINDRISQGNLVQIAYSYVSLFGKNSLTDVRSAIFQSAKSIATDENIEAHFERQLSDNSLLNRIPWGVELAKKATSKLSLLGRLTNIAQAAPGANRFSGVIAAFEYRFVNNYIVCFDDLERKGSALSVREIMGLADELARRKKCKVILIFNDNSFSEEKDKKEFESYREKVVDAELNHNPSHEHNLECIFSGTHKLFPAVKNAAITLDLKNIRVINKLKRLIDIFWPELENADELIVGEFINHATVLCWSYYLRNTALPFDFVVSQLRDESWSSFLLSKDKIISEDETRYRSIATKLHFSPSIFDSQIIFYLEHGYANLAELKTSVKTLSERIDVARAGKNLGDVWAMYSDSFSDNQAEIILSFRRVLSENVKLLGLNEYAAAVDMLSDLGEDVTELVDNYLLHHKERLMTLDRHDAFLSRRVPYEPMLKKIISIQQTNNETDIDQVSMKIAVNRGWNPEDIDFLCSVTVQEYIAWIKSNPIDLHTKLRSGLLFFGNLQTTPGNSDAVKYKQIYQNVHTALTTIATESPINQKRVKAIYQIDVNSPGQTTVSASPPPVITQ